MRIAPTIISLFLLSAATHASTNDYIAVDLKHCELVHLGIVGMKFKEREEFKTRFGNEWAPLEATMYDAKGERKAIVRCALSPYKDSVSRSFSCVGETDFPLNGIKYIESVDQRLVFKCESPCNRGPATVYWVTHDGHVNPLFYAELKKADQQCPSLRSAPQFMRGGHGYVAP